MSAYFLLYATLNQTQVSSFVFAEKTLDHFLPGAIIGRPDQIFAIQDREHLPFLCLHQPAKQIFFRTSRLQSKEKACWRLRRCSQSAERIRPVQMIASAVVCFLHSLTCNRNRNRKMHMFSKPWSGEYRDMLVVGHFYGSGATTSILSTMSWLETKLGV